MIWTAWIVFGFGAGFLLGGIGFHRRARRDLMRAKVALAEAQKTQQLAAEWITMLAHTRAAEAIFSGPSLRDRQAEKPA